MYRRRSKKEQRELDSIKLSINKQYALTRYFSKIERFLRQSEIKTYGLHLVSLTETSDKAVAVIMTYQYKGNQKVEIPYIVDVKIKTENEKKKYYFKLDQVSHDLYNSHIDFYDIEALQIDQAAISKN